MNEVRLETERLILRTYRLDDFEDHFKLCADPNVMRYLLGQKPLSRFEAWRHMAFHPDNKPSIKVAERLGEKLEGQTEVGDMTMLVYGIDNPRR